jgi:hypothetical protein
VHGGVGGRDAEGAAERRLAEALRAQASLGARSAPPQTGGPATPRGGQQVPKIQAPKELPGKAQKPPSGKPRGQPAKPPHPTTAAVGQSGPQHGRGGQSGPPHAPAPGGSRAVRGSGQRGRERPDGQPTQVAGVDPGLAGAPTAQQPPAHAASAGSKSGPRPPHAASGKPPAVQHAGGGGQQAAAAPSTERAAVAAPSPADDRAAPTARLHRVLLAALLAGVLLGCLLAVLSVLDPGLLPALG